MTQLTIFRRTGLRYLSPEQEASLLQSISRAERGELVDGDIVMGRFGRALQEIESR
jgi:hypothetical protein